MRDAWNQKIESLFEEDGCEGTLRNEVILILDTGAEKLPWESMPILFDQPSTRCPSLSFITQRLKERETVFDVGVDMQKKTRYVLDPAGDLSRTRARFSPVFQK